MSVVQLSWTDHGVEPRRIDVVGNQLLADLHVVTLHFVQKRKAAFHRMTAFQVRTISSSLGGSDAA